MASPVPPPRPRRPRWLATLPFFLALTVAVSAIGLALSSKAAGNRASLAIAKLRAVEVAQGIQNATEWKAISGRFLVSSLQPDVPAPRMAAAQAITGAEQLGLSHRTATRLRQAQDAYNATIDATLTMVASGVADQAVLYDSNSVVPALQVLRQQTQLAAQQLDDRGRSAQRVTDVTVIATAVLALLMVTVVQRRRKLSELLAGEQLRSDARYRTLIDQSSDLVLVTDPAGRLSYLGPAAERLLRATAGSAAPNLYSYVHPRDRSSLAVALETTCAAGAPARTSRLTLRLGTGDGNWRDYEVAVQNLIADRAVGGVVLTARDITEQCTLQRAIEHQAMHDSLTGLPNRLLFLDRLTQAIRRGERGHADLAVLYLDLDEFKTVNDSLGHAAGDDLLRALTGRLSAALRASDTLCRLGGDEFAVLLEETHRDEAERTAERLLEAVTEDLTVAGRSLRASASIGVAIRGDTTMSGGELLSAADMAMYAAKRTGKGRFKVYRPEMHDDVLRRAGLEADLRCAADRGEIHVAYQPIVDLSAGNAGRILGMEALMRWASPSWGAVEPGEFIPIAESSGLIVSLGRYVLQTACADTVRWNTGRSRPLKVSVNVSVRQLHEPGFLDLVAAVLVNTGLNPALLTLEITETLMLHSDSGSILAKARLLGVRLSLDDFGTGYASLSHLHALNIDQIKIDMSFVRALEQEPSKDQLTASILDLARNLNLDVVAEGIESVVQLDKLQHMGCPRGQGYLFSRPLGAADFTALLARSATPAPAPRQPLRALPGGRAAPRGSVAVDATETA